ncbi:ATP synthase subunit alpha, mitochondrial [Capsicum chinense]|nr:ATP synthase subunit alpha, mitochondrial [Capsicum chinense]
MVEFASGVIGIALRIEQENVRIIIFGSDTTIKEGDLFKCTGSIVDVPVGKPMLRLKVPTESTLGVTPVPKIVVSRQGSGYRSWLEAMLKTF